MSRTTPNSTDATEALVKEAVAALERGDRPGARALLTWALERDPRNFTAWIWLSGAVTTSGERRYCMEQAVAINPSHTVARRGLAHLQGVTAVSPFASGAAAPREAPPPAAPRPAPAEPKRGTGWLLLGRKERQVGG